MKLFFPNGAPLHSFESFLARYESSDPTSLEVSFHPKWVAVHPLVLSMTACAAEYVRFRGGTVTAPDIPRLATLPYLIRMGLFRSLGVEPPMAIVEHEAAGRFIPLTQVRNNAELKQLIVDMIPLLHATPAEVAPIKYVISELVRNALEHSGSPVGAFVCAQYYKETGRLSLGVADAGIGIREHMSRCHGVAGHLGAIELALRPGITGTTSRLGGTDYNAGGGLFYTKSIACVSRRNFLLYSGSGMFKLRKTPKDAVPVIQADPARDIKTVLDTFQVWQGTAVGIDFSVGDEDWFKTLMNEISRHYSLDLAARNKDKYKTARFR